MSRELTADDLADIQVADLVKTIVGGDGSAKDKIKEQMAQFGQMDPSDKELDDIAARILSNQDEVKRLSEQLVNEKFLNFYKDNMKFDEKEVTYDEFVKEIYE